MGKWLEHVVAAVVWIGVLAAGVWFGGPAIWRHLMAAEQAVATVRAEEGARGAEVKAADGRRAACSAEVVRTLAAAKAIAGASAPRAATPGQPQPLITADQIQAMMQ